MDFIAENIRIAVRQEHYVFGAHADQRMRERKVLAWQVIEGLEHATLLAESPDGIPNPTAEFQQLLPDGTSLKAVWAWISEAGIAKLVTVHFFDR